MVGPHEAEHGAMLAVLALASLVVAALGASGLPATSEQEATPLPFDPPTATEQDVAAEIALASQSVQAMLSEHYVFLGAALHTQKIPDAPMGEYPRFLDTWFYDYASDRVVWAVVDLAANLVVEIMPTDSTFQPPLVSVELSRAVELAFELEATVARFPDGPAPATALLVSGQGTTCPENRCALLAFLGDHGPEMDFLVLVNLSEDRVMDIAESTDAWQEVHRA